MFDLAEVGERMRALRTSRHWSYRAAGLAHCSASKFENGHSRPGIAYIEKLCELFGIGVNRFFGPREQFDAMLAVEDDFALQVRPFLKLLNGDQRKLILKTLEAAPKQIVNHGGRKSASTGNPTLSGSGNFTGSKASITPSQTLPIRYSPSVVSQRTNQAAHR